MHQPLPIGTRKLMAVTIRSFCSQKITISTKLVSSIRILPFLLLFVPLLSRTLLTRQDHTVHITWTQRHVLGKTKTAVFCKNTGSAVKANYRSKYISLHCCVYSEHFVLNTLFRQLHPHSLLPSKLLHGQRLNSSLHYCVYSSTKSAKKWYIQECVRQKIHWILRIQSYIPPYVVRTTCYIPSYVVRITTC
jgi:hypothetical protein